MISEKRFVYVFVENDGEWVLTVMIRCGAAETDMSVKLVESEVDQIKQNPSWVDQLVRQISQCPQNYSDREIMPAVWP